MRNKRSLAIVCLCGLAASTLCGAFQSQSQLRQPLPMTTTSTTLSRKQSYTAKRTAGVFLRMVSIPPKNTLKPKKPKPVFLTHERDFFRQIARVESMDSYVLVSTLTASMSFGCLLGFTPSAFALKAIRRGAVGAIHSGLCQTIQIVSGLSALCGLYSTIIFALTILYSKSALGAERDIEYDKFIRRTVKARVRGFRSFTLSLAMFCFDAMLVLLERTSFRAGFLPVTCVAGLVLYLLYADWTLLHKSAEIIYKD